MGIIENDGICLFSVCIDCLCFVVDMLYEVMFCCDFNVGECVLLFEILFLVKFVLVGVVEGGIVKWIFGMFVDNGGKFIVIGGKIGIGDNCFKMFSCGGGFIFEWVVSCLGVFVFYLGDCYFGIVVVYVVGVDVVKYKFISVLMV